jgi:hypothetical protein
MVCGERDLTEASLKENQRDTARSYNSHSRFPVYEEDEETLVDIHRIGRYKWAERGCECAQ